MFGFVQAKRPVGAPIWPEVSVQAVCHRIDHVDHVLP
jgi:hypothetical protein